MGFVGIAEDSPIPKRRKTSRNCFVGQAEIVGNIDTAHGKNQDLGGSQAPIHFCKKSRDPLKGVLPAQQQNMALRTFKTPGNKLQQFLARKTARF